MTDFLQLFFSGMATGAIYALAALGFTLLWQASGTINFAQGEFVMLPAFMMLAFLAGGLPLWGAFIAACLVSTLVLLGAFYAATDGVIAAVTARLVQPTVRASAIAAAQTTVALARLVSSMLFGVLWFAVGPTVALLLVGGLLLVAIPACLLLARRLDRTAEAL